ncbi:MAG: hypothetical protein IJZ35_02875 [Clostridia bacterium]|nr:hypothetical protein [Clostridia bacterium]
MSLKNEINSYVKNIQKQILYKTKESKQLINDLKANIADYVEENNVTDISEIRQCFGSESEIAADFLANADIKTLKRKMTVKSLIAVLVVAVIAVWGIGMTVAVVDSLNATAAYGVESDIVDEDGSMSNASLEV